MKYLLTVIFLLSCLHGEDLDTKIGDLQIFPKDNAWNWDISDLKVDGKSDAYVKSIGENKPLHPDFGVMWDDAPCGIPFSVVSGKQEKVPVKFEYSDESDKGPYPIPKNTPIEGVNLDWSKDKQDKRDGDRHVIVIDRDNMLLYETWSSYPLNGGEIWKAGSGAIFDLKSNKLRPAGWTSADAAGLPVFPGLVRYEEMVEKGEINHAIRFTCVKTQKKYIYPATHFASNKRETNLPPLGARFRLKADYDISGYPKCGQVLFTALKKHGILLADNGGDWYISGAPDKRWIDTELQTLKKVKGSDFEAVVTIDKTGEPIKPVSRK